MTRCIVIGLDAASWDIIKPLIKRDKLPNITKIIKDGISAPLKSTHPPITPAAWNSMITGVNPGKHGIFDFFEQDPETYSIRPVSSLSLRAKTLWEILNENGFKVGIVNFPVSYPPPKVESFFISGLSSPEQGTYAHPAKLMKYLKKKNYRIHPRFSYKKGLEREYFEEIKELTDIQSKVAFELMKREDWDVFFVVFMGLDWIQHYLWDYEISPGISAVERFYEYIDEKIGPFLENVSSGDYVFIVSDHGMKEIKGEIHINTLLENWGYLKRKDYNRSIKNKIVNTILDTGRKLPFDWKMSIKKVIHSSYMDTILSSQNPLNEFHNQINWKDTKAFSYGFMGRVYIHTENKYSFGIIKPEDYGAMREEIISRLKELKHPETGENVIGRIFTKEEVYDVDSNSCPDIIFNSLGFNYMIYNDFDLTWIGPSKGRKADHSEEGILILKGYGTNVAKIYKIEDITPTILSIFGIDVPEYMDGKCLLRINIKKSDEHFNIPERKSKAIYSKREEEEIKKRLEGLGYL